MFLDALASMGAIGITLGDTNDNVKSHESSINHKSR